MRKTEFFPNLRNNLHEKSFSTKKIVEQLDSYSFVYLLGPQLQTSDFGQFNKNCVVFLAGIL